MTKEFIAKLGQKRVALSAVLFKNKQIIITGGHVGGPYAPYTDAVHRLDLVSRRFIEAPKLNTGRC